MGPRDAREVWLQEAIICVTFQLSEVFRVFVLSGFRDSIGLDSQEYHDIPKGRKHESQTVIVMKNLIIINQAIAIIAGLFYMLAPDPKIFRVLRFLPFICFPIFITQICSLIFRIKKSQIILLFALLLYLLWFGLVYMTLVHWTSNALNAIGFLFVGIYALPVMLIFWMAQLIIWVKEKLENKKGAENKKSPDYLLVHFNSSGPRENTRP